MMRSVFFAMLVSLVLFSGCKTLEPEPALPLPLVIPEHFSMDAGSDDAIEDWWLFFNSDELNALIKDAVDHNFDLKILKAKIIQAKAGVAKEEAAFFPDFGFSMSGQKIGTQAKSSYGSSSSYDDSHSWDGSLASSYTADVWGQANAEKQAKILGLKAATHDLRGATLELTSVIAETWIDIIAARNKKSILDNQININKTLLELQKLRFVNGKAKALDVSQQREALAAASSQVPLLEKQERLLLNTLVFLSGRTTVDNFSMTTSVLPEPVPLSRVGIPSDLLENRVDIQAARMRLISSQRTVSAAKADLLPSFKLTAQALFSSGHLDLLFQNWVATLVGSIAGPIFDGGFRKAEVSRAKAYTQEKLSFYAKTVANAIRQVEDRLVSIQKQAVYIKLLEEELSVVRLILKDARFQYQNGQSSYLSYLIAWTSIESLERQLVGEKATMMKERIGLHRDLGWKPVE
ncbi:efflux transporter outer membrane subunit [Desulfobacula sp.]